MNIDQWRNCEMIARHCYVPLTTNPIQINGVWRLPPLPPLTERSVKVSSRSEQLQSPYGANLRNNAYSIFLETLNFEEMTEIPQRLNDFLNDVPTFYYFLYNLPVVKCNYNGTRFFYTTFETRSEPLFVFDRIQWQTFDSVKIIKVLFMNHP